MTLQRQKRDKPEDLPGGVLVDSEAEKIVSLRSKYMRITMPSARLLGQINKIRETYLRLYHSSVVKCLDKSRRLLKTTFRMHKETVCPAGFRVALF